MRYAWSLSLSQFERFRLPLKPKDKTGGYNDSIDSHTFPGATNLNPCGEIPTHTTSGCMIEVKMKLGDGTVPSIPWIAFRRNKCKFEPRLSPK